MKYTMTSTHQSKVGKHIHENKTSPSENGCLG